MWVTPALAIMSILALYYLKPEVLVIAMPFICLWLAAPGLAWWLSEPLPRNEAKLNERQKIFLHKIARKTWAFFERFVVADENWLPPDNFQEQPGPLIAHRTSPTNIGMALLSNLAARDFGYISAGQLLQLTTNTFSTMSRLERHQGHFYNWYDTLSLLPLAPRYISSVDSGNLAGHLLTLRSGLLALPDQKIVGARLFHGLLDTLAILIDEKPNANKIILSQIQTLLSIHCTDHPASLSATYRALQEILNNWATLILSVDEPSGDAIADNEASYWTNTFEQQCHAAFEELKWLAPWLEMLTTPIGNELSLTLSKSLSELPTLRDLETHRESFLLKINDQRLAELTAEQQSWVIQFNQQIEISAERALERIALIENLALQATDFSSLEYEFLYDRTRHLLAIGYNVDEFRRDASFYDLLASEARLCSFIAIAQGQLPQESWFALGRLQTSFGGDPILVSWSGSMFEYLMPLLVMPSYEGTLLDQTYQAAVSRQIAYGNQRGLPWGVSESGYNTVDAGLNYQYHAFGVPGLGLKRGLAEDLVVAPYASALALMVAPEAACTNLQRLTSCGMEGRFGFYEAIDYTPSRQTRNDSDNRASRDTTIEGTGAIVRSFMAHHQGMSLLSLAHVLLGQPMQQRFESDLSFQATLLLLQERIPKNTIVQKRNIEDTEGAAFSDVSETSTHIPMAADTSNPEVQLLSNGRYQVMVTNAGGGYSR
ncbi:MAG: glucoamylase family protein, partial [Arenimonas sp.]